MIAALKRFIESKDKKGIIKFLDAKELGKLGEGIRLIKASKGDVLFTRKDAADTKKQFLYIILEGKVKYEKKSASGKTIAEAINFPYEYFGEQPILNRRMTNSTNTVVSDSALLLQISREKFLGLLSSYKDNMISLFCDEMAFDTPFPKALASALICAGRLNVYRKHHAICIEGGVPKHVDFVLDGNCFLLKESLKIGVTFSRGSIIGDIEALIEEHREKYLGTVITSSDVVTFEVPMGKFIKAMERFPLSKMLLRRKAETKKKAGLLIRYAIRDFPYTYSFKLLKRSKNKEAAERSRQQILESARHLILDIVTTNPKIDDTKAVGKLFDFICSSLENQEMYDPIHFVSHGFAHSKSTVKYALSLLENIPALQQNFYDIFGRNGRHLLVLACLLHDVGYPKYILNIGKNESIAAKRRVFKFMHQEYSAEMVSKNFPFSSANKIFGIDKKQYHLFIESIQHHASDNLEQHRDPEIKRPYLATTNVKNPMLFAIRVADNLDLIRERLTKLQKDPVFLTALKWVNKKTGSEEALSKEKILQLTEDVKKTLNEAKKSKSIKPVLKYLKENNTPQDYQKYMNNVVDLSQIDNTYITTICKNIYSLRFSTEYLHFKSIDLGQCVFVTEEKDSEGKDKINIYLVFNESEKYLSSALIEWQSGRLKKSTESLKFIKNGRNIKMDLKLVFPNP